VIVVDSSAMVHALIGASVNPRLLALLAVEDLCAPHLIDFEVTSALRGHVLGRKLAASRGRDALRDYAALTVTRYDGVGLLDAIWRLRDTFTVYDAAYVTLALALGCPLATSDGKLREAERLGVDVRMYPPAGKS
jgi:predicted nucleic acid-binding protein